MINNTYANAERYALRQNKIIICITDNAYAKRRKTIVETKQNNNQDTIHFEWMNIQSDH